MIIILWNREAFENIINDYYKLNNEKQQQVNVFIVRQIIASKPNSNSRFLKKIVASLKYWSDFWKSFDLSLINREIELNLTWSRYLFTRTISFVWHCVIFEIINTPETYAYPNVDPHIVHAPESVTAGATFQTNNAKFYVPVVALVKNDNIKFLEHLKQGFKRIVSWDKYRSEITTQWRKR